MASIHQTLLEIKESQAFERLEPFKDSKVWKKMETEERKLFALLLLMQGSHQLSQGDQKVFENFEIASKVSSFSPSIYYQQGMIFSSYEENSRCLHLSCQAFAQAVEKAPDFIEAWYQWGNVLLKLGVLEGEGNDLYEADKKFERVCSLFDQCSTELTKEQFFWQWAFCLSLIGRYSGEPHDFYRAIEKYRLAEELGNQTGPFYNDYGYTLFELAILVGQIPLLVEAFKYFSQAVQMEPDFFEGWYNRACALQKLLEYTIKDELLEYAQISFTRAAELKSDHAQLWLKWAQLDVMVGKLKRDEKKIEASLEKFVKADQLDPEHPLILAHWGETELFLGTSQEHLKQIQSAKAKILKSLELQPDNPDIWYLYGSCLNEIGRYFSDDTFYHQAIEKFQHGLSLDKHHPLLWYGLALAYYAIGELKDSIPMFEKAVRFCSRVMDCGGGIFPQFWNDWGVALMKLAEANHQPIYVQQAIEKFEMAFKQPIQSLEYEDLDLEWVYNYGCAFDLLGDLTGENQHFEKAIQILNQVIQLDPNYLQAQFNLALAFTHLGEATEDIEYYYKALEQFQNLVEKDPEDECVQLDLGISLIHLAFLVQEEHLPEAAETLLQQAEHHLCLAAYLGNRQAYYQLACLHSILKHYEQAMFFIERADAFEGLPSPDDLMHDDWLEDLRETPHFRQFLQDLSQRAKKDE